MFDVDGTMAETEEFHRRAFNEAFSYFDLPWNWDVATYGRLLRVAGGRERIRHFWQSLPEDRFDLGDRFDLPDSQLITRSLYFRDEDFTGAACVTDDLTDLPDDFWFDPDL
ncbi:beta-phosphoglucomutase-like phosphatase (HAD superfamily) [Bradyrhizobium sp. AZCC 2262]|uniref:hypothetical protein n=1 Tax=Bradyrhizobium sp. AZCC 2262 TaxID=3117022 RepID=UPI00302BAE3E